MAKKKQEQETEERPEMPVQEALSKFKELRRYVSMEGEFRTGLSKKALAEGKKMVAQLNIKDCKLAGTYWSDVEKKAKNQS